MLTDIFARRYENRALFPVMTERLSRLLVQSYGIVSNQIYPYSGHDGKPLHGAKERWQSIHDRLAMELGVQSLSVTHWSSEVTLGGNRTTLWNAYSPNQLCRGFMLSPHSASIDPDRFMKDRLSLIEIAFRDREQEIAATNAKLPGVLATARAQDLHAEKHGGIRIPGKRVDGVLAHNKTINQLFNGYVAELNERFRQAHVNLNYHNGFIQIASDQLVGKMIETPFWEVVREPKWKNVDTDMKEAIDRRDTGARDPAWYAARALESAIKIISGEYGWTHGGEKGAHNYIDNLAAAKNGSFIAKWESESLKHFFTELRNDFGHGPGANPMPALSLQQTDWAIEFAMAWIKSLVRRMGKAKQDCLPETT